jgi:hypothetical protein
MAGNSLSRTGWVSGMEADDIFPISNDYALKSHFIS